MNKLLRKSKDDEVVIYTYLVYSIDVLNECREIHKKLVDEGKIEGDFDSDKWIGYSGIKKIGIDFSMDIILYNKHIGNKLGITADTMKNMLRCYAIYCNGVYTYRTIQEKIGIVKKFLLKYNDKDFLSKLTNTRINTIKDFLRFTGTPNKQIEEIFSNIRLIKNDEKAQRKSTPIINYLVIENEINRIYKEGCNDEVFKKWFPIYFWVNITFILPLRATEMLITPQKCIYKENDKTFLRIHLKRLKKGITTDCNDVNNDYQEFTYEIPDTEVIRNIEKYIKMTDSQDRRFLFEYNESMSNETLSLQAFNHLIATFVEENIIGNNRYDFEKYATGIKEFEPVTADNSRLIAMANLYFQKSGEDICRQLASHIKINTSSGYRPNISDIIWASSVARLQKKLDCECIYSKEQYEQSGSMAVNTEKSVCTSPKRMVDEENIDDCIEQRQLSECMGCKFYRPSKAELDAFMRIEQKKADDSAKEVIEFMNNITNITPIDLTLQEIFLSAQTYAARYRMVCNIKAGEKLKEWQRFKNIH